MKKFKFTKKEWIETEEKPKTKYMILEDGVITNGEVALLAEYVNQTGLNLVSFNDCHLKTEYNFKSLLDFEFYNKGTTEITIDFNKTTRAGFMFIGHDDLGIYGLQKDYIKRLQAISKHIKIIRRPKMELSSQLQIVLDNKVIGVIMPTVE